MLDCGLCQCDHDLFMKKKLPKYVLLIFCIHNNMLFNQYNQGLYRHGLGKGRIGKQVKAVSWALVRVNSDG